MNTAKETFTKQTKEAITVDEDAIKIEKDKEETVADNANQNGKLKSTAQKMKSDYFELSACANGSFLYRRKSTKCSNKPEHVSIRSNGACIQFERNRESRLIVNRVDY